MTSAFQYVIENEGIDSDAAYPYVGQVRHLLKRHVPTLMLNSGHNIINSHAHGFFFFIFQGGNCKYDPKNRAATCSSYISLPKGDEHALKEALASVGPISVAIDASRSKFAFYRHGE